MNHYYPKALVGNRILSLLIRQDEKNEPIQVVSEDSPSIFYFCPELEAKAHFLDVLDAQLRKAGPDVIGIQILEPDGAATLRFGLERAISVPLVAVSVSKTHINKAFETLKSNLEQIRRERDDLQRKYEEQTKEMDKISQQMEWKSRENELLRLLLDKDHGREHVHGHCEPCSCSSAPVLEADHPMDEVPDTSMMEGARSPDLKAEDLLFNDSPSTPTAAASPQPGPSSDLLPSSKSVEKANKSEELLWGVAQYIFCQLCPEQSQDVRGMENHFMNAHLDKEKRNCTACPSETLHDLSGHVQQHTSRVYVCEFCGKRGRKHFLKSHIRTHTGEKPFNCETCGRCFSDVSTLRRHKLVHSGVKAHKCPICGIGIARKDNVKVHIKSHGREGLALLESLS